MALSSPASAQSPVTSILLDPVTILATKTEEKAIDSLSAVSTLRQDDINRIGPSRLENLLVGVPGVWFQERSDSPETSINIRGLQDFGRVAVIVDGARQNFQRTGHNANGSFLLDPELLAGVDIVRGPVANIYGSGAIGGVASFRTKDADDILRPGQNFATQLHGALASNPSNPLGSAFAAAHLGPNVDVIAGGSTRHNGDYKDGNGDVIPNTGYDLASGLAKITVRPAEGHQFKLSGITEDSRYKTGQFVVPPPAQPESVYDTKLTTHIASARWTYHRPEDRFFDFDGNVYWTQTLQEQVKIRGSSNAITGSVGDFRSFKIDTTGFDVHNTSRFDTGALRHAVTYGGDYFVDHVNVTDPTGTGDLFTPNGQRTVSGSFVQWKANYESWLELIGAARYDSYELNGGNVTTDGDRVSPKMTVGITPLPWFTIYGTYAEGYRAPSLTETIVVGAHPPFASFPGAPAGFTFVPNPNLRPEVGKNKEIGVNIRQDGLFTKGDKLRFKANVFRNDLDNYIELVAFGPINLWGIPSFEQYQNLTNARLEGAEFEGSYDAGAWFAQIAGSHVTGKEASTGIPLASIPPDKLALTFGMRFFDRKLTALVRWIGVADKKASDIPDRDSSGSPDFLPTSGYGLVNFYLGYQHSQDTLLSFGVDNVFDRYYVPYMAESANRAFAGPGIRFKFGLQVRFGDDFFKKG